MLSDPEKRREYDARGFAGVAGFSEEDLFRHIDFGDLFGGLNFDFGDLRFGVGGGLFDGFFGRRRAGPARGRNIEVELEVPLTRVVTVTIPPGTQPGSVLRLAGKGLPEFGGRARGHLYLRLDVQVPEHSSRRQRELYEQLRALEAPQRAGPSSTRHAGDR